MLRPWQTSGIDLFGLLEQLPEDYLVAPVQSSWFVVGPPGVYVVCPEPTEGNDDGGAGRLANQVRSALAQHLTWVPFVHAHLISDDLRPIPQATVVPPDMLLRVLTEGRRSIDEETMQRIAEIVSRGLLPQQAPPVEDGLGTARMTPCAPSPSPPGPSSPSTTSAAPATRSSSPTPPGSTDGSGPPSSDD